MKTVSINVSTLCVPCANRCRYCLLSWDGQLPGADYERSRRYAERFYRWIQAERPDLSFQFYFGYSMEHPRLLDAIDFARSIGSAPGEFLQFDGMRFRSQAELMQLLGDIKQHGVHLIDLTVYGTRAYHDRFAGRQGDFDFMMDILTQANRLGLDVSIGVPVTAENADQLDELLTVFSAYAVRNLYVFVPHGEGRGASLEPVRLTSRQYDGLPDRVKQHFNRRKFRPEGEWLKGNNFSVPEKRMLGLTLTAGNIAHFESRPFDAVIAELEKLDDDFYAIMPSLPELARQYGNPDGDCLFSERDLYLYYQRLHRKHSGLVLYDINDERLCFSRRY